MPNLLQTKIGFYFGTFNPIHLGHLAIAQYAQEQFKLEKIIFVPSGRPPFKSEDPDLADAETRYHLVELAIADHPNWEIDRVEIDRSEKSEGLSYTIDTLKSIRSKYNLGQSKIPFIIGSDALSDLHVWHRPIEMLKEVCFLQAPRNGFPSLKIIDLEGMLIPLDTRLIKMPEDKNSSTEIREQ